MLVVTGGRDVDDANTFQSYCNIFDGRDDAQVHTAREAWKRLKAENHTLTYYQQGEKGWEKKA